ncbi:MAG: TolC family protein [Bacteroidota bacterium]
MKKIQFLLLLLFASVLAQAQTNMRIDTSKIFSLEDYLSWVRQHHPVARQALLLLVEADAELMKARGGFDPKLYGDYEQKSFDGKNYFQIGEAGVGVPTWFGADFKVAYNWTDGIFLNPEANLPDVGQIVAGINMPLLQGMMFDERRAQVQQAELIKDLNDAERRALFNDLLMDAVEVYWNWVYNYNVLQTFQNALNLAQQRFLITRESFFQGDKPAIDTLESYIQVQNRLVDLAEAQVGVENALLDVSNFLWYEEVIPLKVIAPLRPEPLAVFESPDYQNQINTWISNLENIHPDLQAIQAKQEQLEIKERLKREYMKPRLDAEYNFLSGGLDFLYTTKGDDAQLSALLTDNYKWGLSFNFPLFLRKERAGLQLVRIEQLDNQYKFNNKEWEIENKINMLFQQLETTEQQIDISEDMLQNYRDLLAAENEKFRFGESSIFLLNSREQKLIESQLKLLKLQASYKKLQSKVAWAAGQLQ